MAEVLTNQWTAVRVANLPLAPDVDWRATNDIEGFKNVSELFTIVPKANTSGSFQLALMYCDASGGLVIPAANSRVTIEMLQLTVVTPRPSIGLLSKIVTMRSGPDVTLKGEEIVNGEVLGKFKQDIGIRMVSTQSEPSGAAVVIVLARFA